MMIDHPVPSGESETLAAIARCARNWDDDARLLGNLRAAEIGDACEWAAAEVARLTAGRDDHGPNGRNVTNAQHLAMRERALAAEAEAARYREALRDAWLLVQNAAPHAWDNGNTGPGGYPDEGAVLASQIMERVAPVADPLLELTTEGGDRAE